ncbi:MAG TPA: NADH-quinone oxidoreductase subunit N [Vicinamibacteria bacterium]|nr:NADH-quinone oxidoreductase subunit N [Vicinamibacteria bacterium]
MDEVARSLALFTPEVALTAGLLLVVLVDASGASWRASAGRFLTLASMAAALVLALRLPVGGRGASIFAGMLVVDPLGLFFKVLLLAASLLTVLLFTFRNSRELFGLGQGEFHALLLAVTLSNLLMASSNDLVMLYLSLEMVSITSYVMVAYIKGDRMSNEASLKYILFGAVSTGAMLYGLSLLYGMTGATSLPRIQEFLAAGLSDQNRFAVYLITFLIVAGFGFKVAAVPFHFWCPDVYQGAPTPVTAFLSVAPKAAGFAIMLRFFFGGFAMSGTGPWDLAGTIEWPRLLMAVSVLTMTVGNVAALTQTDMKRLLAYSSIAHAGYIMMGVVALSENGARGLMIYLAAYVFMNLGAFLVVTLVHLHDGSFDLRDYPGLYRRAPLLTAAMGVFLLSLVGIPPFVGFMGKLYVFAAVVERGPEYWWYAVAGALNAAVAAFYYFRVMKTMVIDAGNEEKPPFRLAFADRASLVLLAAANLLPLAFWSGIEGWARQSLVLYAGR